MAALEEGKKITHIPTILKEAEKALEKLEGTEEYPVIKELFEALGTSFRKRAYGYNLNELYTVSEMLKSKKITADDLAEVLNRIQATDKLIEKEPKPLRHLYNSLKRALRRDNFPEEFIYSKEEAIDLIKHIEEIAKRLGPK